MTYDERRERIRAWRGRIAKHRQQRQIDTDAGYVGDYIQQQKQQELIKPWAQQPEAEVPEWSTPVPDTWGQWAKWWLGRQVSQVKDWWSEATEAVETRAETKGDWNSIWQDIQSYRQKEKELAKAYYADPLDFGAKFERAKHAVGVIGTSIEALKKTGAGIGAVIEAVEQATRGVTGGVFKAFDAVAKITKQGILGAAEELIFPLTQGQVEVDYTPQEFEANAAFYTQTWEAIDTYAKELVRGVKSGKSIGEADVAAVAKADVAYEEYERAILDRIDEGATVEEIQAEFVNPIVEMVGEAIFDPLNLIPSGKAGMSAKATKKWKKLVGVKQALSHDELFDTMRVSGAAGGIRRVIDQVHPFPLTNEALGGQWVENAIDTIGIMIRRSQTTEEAGRVVELMAVADRSAEAMNTLRKTWGVLPESTVGKQTTLILREMAKDAELGHVTQASLRKLAKSIIGEGESVDNVLVRLMDNMGKAALEVYPVKPKNIIRHTQDMYRSVLSRYFYMGLNPAYAFKNLISNKALMTANGLSPFMSAAKRTEYLTRFGHVGLGARRAFGGPGGMFREIAEKGVMSPFADEAMSWKDAIKTGQKGLKEFWNGRVFLDLSADFERMDSEIIAIQTIDRFMRDNWGPKVPGQLRKLLGRNRAKALEQLVASSLNEDELRAAAELMVMGRHIPDSLIDAIKSAPRGVADEIGRALVEADDVNDFRRKMQQLTSSAEEWLGQRAAEAVPELPLESLEGDYARKIQSMLEELGDSGVVEEDVLKALKENANAFEVDLSVNRARLRAYESLANARAAGNVERERQSLALATKWHDEFDRLIRDTDAMREEVFRQMAQAATPGQQSQIMGGYTDLVRPMFDDLWNKAAKEWEDFLGGNLSGDLLSQYQKEYLGNLANEAEHWARLKDKTPPSTLEIQSASVKATQELLARMADEVGDEVFADLGPMLPRTLAATSSWIDDLVPQLNTTKAIGTKVSTEVRDYILFNYGNRRSIDEFLAYIYPYHFWYTRAVPAWGKTMLTNPKIMTKYGRYRKAIEALNKEAGGLPWWEGQVKVPFIDMYFNLEATLNPLHGVMEQFEDPERTQTPTGELLQTLGSYGPSIDALYWGLYALSRKAEGEEEEALASFGYLGATTKALKYATALLGVGPEGGVVLEPWLWSGGLFQGGDKWERRRIGYELKAMVDEGIITFEEAWDTANRQDGDAWRMAVDRVAKARAVGSLTSWAIGAGFKGRFPYEVEVGRAMQAAQVLWDHKDEYNLETEQGQELWSQEWRELHKTYPFLGLVQTARKGQLERDQSYAWNVLGRLPPGNQREVIFDMANMDWDILSKWYASGGDLSQWVDADRGMLMSSIEAMAAVIGIPDDYREDEWDQAIEIYGRLRDEMPEGLRQIQDAWGEIKTTLGDEAAQVFLDGHEELREWWSYKNQVVVSNPMLYAYYGDIDLLERVAQDVLHKGAEQLWPGIHETSTEYQSIETKEDKRAYLKSHPELKDYWDYLDEGGDIAAETVDEVAAEMPPPLGPIVRPDSDIESVLSERLLKKLKAMYTTGEVIAPPRREPIPTGPSADITRAGDIKNSSSPILDIARQTVVQLEEEGGSGSGGGYSGGSGGGYARTSTAEFSWQAVENTLGGDIPALVQYFRTGKPLKGELLAKLEGLFGENPAGFTEFEEWLDFVRSLWVLSMVTRGGYRIGGIAERQKPLKAVSQAGFGRTIKPWD